MWGELDEKNEERNLWTDKLVTATDVCGWKNPENKDEMNDTFITDGWHLDDRLILGDCQRWWMAEKPMEASVAWLNCKMIACLYIGRVADNGEILLFWLDGE